MNQDFPLIYKVGNIVMFVLQEEQNDFSKKVTYSGN